MDEKKKKKKGYRYEIRIIKRTPNLKVRRLKIRENEKEEDCLICLEQIERKTRIYELKCLHKFHKECIEQWYETEIEEPERKCPKCRERIIIKDEEYIVTN